MYLNEAVAPAGEPFIFSDKGVLRLKADDNRKINLRLTSTEPQNYQEPVEYLDKSYLTPGRAYELFYWHEDEWQTAGRLTAGKEPLIFLNVPTGALYRLVSDDDNGGERPFVTDDGRMIHWL
jgi:hypothetical protein